MFYKGEKYLKPLRTEDSALAILSEIPKVFSFPRIVLPSHWQGLGGREIDSVLVGEFGVILVEVKRQSGTPSKQMGRDRQRVTLPNGEIVLRPNPVVDLKKKIQAIESAFSGEVDLHPLCAAWKREFGLSAIPARALLVYGPTTNLERLHESNPQIEVATTRTLRREILKLIKVLPKLRGTAEVLSRGFGSVCKHMGILTLRGVSGFERVAPCEIIGADKTEVYGLVHAESKGRGTRLIWSNGEKERLIRGSITFRAHNGYRFSFDASDRFCWRAGGR